MSLQALRPATEAYLELSRTSRMEFFCQNRLWLWKFQKIHEQLLLTQSYRKASSTV